MIVDDNSKQENLEKITTLAKNSNLKTEILNLDHHKYKNVIKEQKNEQTLSNAGPTSAFGTDLMPSERF